MNKCKSCKFWKNNQRDIEYTKFYGYCICPKMRFNIDTGIPVGVQDVNDHAKSDVLKYEFETVDELSADDRIRSSRYRLVTEEEFGCIFHESK